jgi:hypothetical protein
LSVAYNKKMSGISLIFYQRDGSTRTLQPKNAETFLKEFKKIDTHRFTWLPTEVAGFFDPDLPWLPVKGANIYLQDPNMTDTCWHSSVLFLVANGQTTIAMSEQQGRRQLADAQGRQMRPYRIFHPTAFTPIPPLINTVGLAAPPAVEAAYNAAQKLLAPPRVNRPSKWCNGGPSTSAHVVVFEGSTPWAAAINNQQVPLAFVHIDAGTEPLYQSLFDRNILHFMEAHRKRYGNDYVLAVIDHNQQLHLNSVPPREFALVGDW